jgi:hypothetical protein
MKGRRNHVIGSLGAAALIAGAAAPVTLAGHEEYGVRCALALSQHRPDAGAICAKSVGDRAAATPNVTIVEPGSFSWGDAGVGTAGTLGLIALAGGVVITTRHGARSRA